MTAPNHALTGALIGLTVSNPLIALPMAFMSHFVCDAIPHYDQPGKDNGKRISSRRFIIEQLLIGATLCGLLVLCIALTRPKHWLAAVVCAFLAASPDLFWIPRFAHALQTRKIRPTKNLFLRFHSALQWRTGPQFIWVEAVWFVLLGTLVVSKL